MLSRYAATVLGWEDRRDCNTGWSSGTSSLSIHSTDSVGSFPGSSLAPTKNEARGEPGNKATDSDNLHSCKIKPSGAQSKASVSPYTMAVVWVESEVEVMARENATRCTNLSTQTRMVQSTGAVLWSGFVPPHSDEGYLHSVEKLVIETGLASFIDHTGK